MHLFAAQAADLEGAGAGGGAGAGPSAGGACGAGGGALLSPVDMQSSLDRMFEGE